MCILESVTFQLRDRMLRLFSVANKKLWTFFGGWGQDHSESPPCSITLIFSSKWNTAIHGLDVDVTATA